MNTRRATRYPSVLNVRLRQADRDALEALALEVDLPVSIVVRRIITEAIAAAEVRDRAAV